MNNRKIDRFLRKFMEVNIKDDYVWGHDTAIMSVEEAREIVRKFVEKASDNTNYAKGDADEL